MPQQLVIYFIRGQEYNNNSKIIFEENLNLINYIEKNNESTKEFYFVGSINRRKINEKEEEFICYTRKQNNNRWYISNMNGLRKYDNANSPIKEIQSDGQIIMLFYNEKK